MLNETYDYEKIEAIERMLTTSVGVDVKMSGTTRNGIFFENDTNEMLKVFLKIDKETFEILDIEISYHYCDIPRLREIIEENYIEMLRDDFR